MFTGIIKSVGIIEGGPNPLKIKHDLEVKPGDSVAVNGVCLTVKDDGGFDLMDETIERTNLGALQKGDKVNLEPAMGLNDKIDGHLVTGHVDFVGEVLEGENLRVSFPADYGKFMAIKGSVSINGTSLTISNLDNNWLEVCLVGFTLKNTNLGYLKPGDKANVEVDLIARYVSRMLNS